MFERDDWGSSLNTGSLPGKENCNLFSLHKSFHFLAFMEHKIIFFKEYLDHSFQYNKDE